MMLLAGVPAYQIYYRDVKQVGVTESSLLGAGSYQGGDSDFIQLDGQPAVADINPVVLDTPSVEPAVGPMGAAGGREPTVPPPGASDVTAL